MAEPLGGHAVVVGASISGLLTAQVLTRHYERVTLVERDALPDGPQFRKGVPQARHPHALLAKGRQILAEMFFGIHQQFLDAGAIEVEWPTDLLQHGEAGWEYRGPRGAGLTTISATRSLIDWVVRRNVLAAAGVSVLTRHEAVGLVSDDGARSVSGLRVRQRGSATAGVRELAADLVVDASGRDSKAVRWLEQLGTEPPAETRINPRQGYATAVFRRERGSLDDWRTLVCLPYPGRPRGCVMVPVEGDRWIATVTGCGGDYPPTELDGYLDFARSLEGGVLHEAVAGAELLEPIRGYRDMANILWHYERLPRQPERFLVIGDAACAFNPVYAQGMTVAALAADTLRDCLQRYARRGTTAGLSRHFQRRLAATVKAPWQMATGQDLAFPGTAGRPGLTDRMMQPYLSRVMRASAAGPPAAYQVNRVMHMIDSASALFRPAMVRAALTPGQSGSAAPVPAAGPNPVSPPHARPES
ncbi:FAD-dependent oxidoreductase [Streptomyces gobiensis]|uniref:FAD-dependent oxidoreductase n=1 Tax=Streptomyces gobiensis TaxID=2875706 RepID=UPI001E352698|nr:FAD-dependent monooxygenase [Streptomyces gobiensis]UGY94211.1 hypothetical protein test1122_22435 [Streptomyces gobiensis]